jgi:hypothetical protein
MFCREATIRASSDYGEVIAPIKCRSWNCPECGPERARQLRSRGIRGRPNRFITLTCRIPTFSTKECQAKALAYAWRVIVQRWRRLKKWHKCEYLCVFEAHKNGWPHLHILWRGHWMSQAWLSEQMVELLGSHRQDIREIKSLKQGVYYVTKYITEALVRFGSAKRYWTSRNWPKAWDTDVEPAFPKGVAVTHVPESEHTILRQWRAAGHEVWTIARRVYGWGVLVNRETGEIHERPSTATPFEWDVAFNDD